jgi:predicted Fe-S protein YdhL (DUF1289 family)
VFTDFLADLRDSLNHGRHAHVIMGFGDATFPAKFPMRALRKVMRRLANTHCDVLTFLDVDEFRTSMNCRGCGRKLANVYRVQLKSKKTNKKKVARAKRARRASRKAKAEAEAAAATAAVAVSISAWMTR